MSAVRRGVPTMNYLLLLGLALLSSASGALLVTLLHLTRERHSRSSLPPDTSSSLAQESSE